MQQLDRILSVVMKANIVKEQCTEIADKNLFEVGFFVGKSNTPNNISSREPLSDRGHYVRKGLILDSDVDTLNEYYRFIDSGVRALCRLKASGCNGLRGSNPMLSANTK